MIMIEIFFTLIFIKRGNEILLGKKKRGFGEDTWNGYGGKLEANESKYQCAVRELKEESNLNVKEKDLKYLGDVIFLTNFTSVKRVVHIFTTTEVTGELSETEEMVPQWFDINKIPYNDMLPDSRYWIPLVLNDSHFNAEFTLDENNDILKKNISTK